MKMKSFAMLAASGLLAAAVGYIAPAMADDSMPGQSTQAPSDNSAGTQTPDNNVGSMNNASGATDAIGNNSSSSSSSSTGSDEGSPDTASGDDDY